MTLEELVQEYEQRRLEAERHAYTAPASRLYSIVLSDLRSLDGIESPDGMMKTSEASKILGVAPKTVRAWSACQNSTE